MSVTKGKGEEEKKVEGDVPKVPAAEVKEDVSAAKGKPYCLISVSHFVKRKIQSQLK